MKKLFIITLLALIVPSQTLAKNLASTFNKIKTDSWIAWEVTKNNPNVHQCWGNGYQHYSDLSSDEMTIYVQKGNNGQVKDFRMITPGCEVQNLDQVTALTDISAEQSVKFIDKLLRSEHIRDSRKLTDRVIHALALHDIDEAFEKLTDFYDQSSDSKQQELIQLLASSLWEQAGYQFLKREWSKAKGVEGKKHLTFVMSQSPVKEARELILKQAQSAKSVEVQKNAIFWYAQAATEGTAEDLLAILKKEQRRSVQEHLVFSLSQIEDGKGLPYLVDLIKTSKNMHVKQQALFWLAHNDEDSAMPILEELLAEKE